MKKLKEEVQNALMKGAQPEQAMVDLIYYKLYERDLNWIKRISYVAGVALIVIIGIVIISKN